MRDRDLEKKVAFDRFHVAKHIGDGVNKVRVEENVEQGESYRLREAMADADDAAPAETAPRGKGRKRR